MLPTTTVSLNIKPVLWKDSLTIEDATSGSNSARNIHSAEIKANL